MKFKDWVFKKVLVNEEYFVFWTSLIFYSLLYFNLNNKTLLGLFILFLLVFWKKLKSLKVALFILYLLFLPFGKGKTFDFVLIPAHLINTYLPYTYGLTITFADLAFLGAFLLILREGIIRRTNGLRPKGGDFFLFAFLSFVFLSIFFSQFQLVSFLAFLKLLRIVAAYFLVQRFLSEKNMKRFTPLILVSLLFFQGAWSGLQFLLKRPLGKAIEPVGALFSAYGQTAAEEQTFFRSQGTFEHPNTLASFLVMFLSFFLVQAFDLKQDEWQKKVFLGGFLLGFLGLIFSASRASWVVFLTTGFLALVFLKKKRKLTVTPLVKKWLTGVFIAFCVFIPLLILPRLSHLYLALAEKGGVYYRTYLIEKAWYLAQEAPLGIGLATFPAVLIQRFGFFTWPTPVHNLWVEILVEAGIFSLIFVLFFLISVYRRLLLGLKKIDNNDQFFLKTSAFFASLGFLGVAEFYPFFWSSGVFEYFWLFLGIMVY